MKVIIELNDQPDGNVKIEMSAEPEYDGEVSRALEFGYKLTKVAKILYGEAE